MLRKTSALVKLVGVCTFLWVLAIQADHTADTVLDNQHVNCLVCKNAGEPLFAQDAIPALSQVDYTAQNIKAALYSQTAQAVAVAYLVRGPPAQT